MKLLVALLALAAVSSPALAQKRMALSQEQQDGVNWMVAHGGAMSYAEAEMFIHIGQAKEAACKIDVRSQECQQLAALLDKERATMNRRVQTGAYPAAMMRSGTLTAK